MEKAYVKRSGAISMGMEGLNNAVVPGYATPEQYVREITIANDGIVHQPALMAYAARSFEMIRDLDTLRVKFERDGTGEYAMRKIHHLGTYVLPMPEGHNVKKALYRRLRGLRVDITNRFLATRLVTGADGSIAGSEGGANRWAIVASLVETAKLNGVGPFTWLSVSLTLMINGYSVSQLDALLP